jgi:hypothetical protein
MHWPMWVTIHFDRVRRRLRAPGAEPASGSVLVDDSDPLDDITVALGRPDLERLITGLSSLEPGMPRPDSPARLAGAVAAAIDRVGGRGQPTVTRSPAGLYTPEYWHVRIDGADAATRAALERLANGRGLT